MKQTTTTEPVSQKQFQGEATPEPLNSFTDTVQQTTQLIKQTASSLIEEHNFSDRNKLFFSLYNDKQHQRSLLLFQNLKGQSETTPQTVDADSTLTQTIQKITLNTVHILECLLNPEKLGEVKSKTENKEVLEQHFFDFLANYFQFFLLVLNKEKRNSDFKLFLQTEIVRLPKNSNETTVQSCSVWELILIKDDNVLFSDVRNRSVINALCLRCFVCRFFESQTHMLRLGRNSIHSWDPVSRDSLRNRNRQSLSKEGLSAGKAFESAKDILNNKLLLEGLGVECFTDSWPQTDVFDKSIGNYSSLCMPELILKLLTELFEFGILDSKNCETLMLSLSQFCNDLQSKFIDLKKSAVESSTYGFEISFMRCRCQVLSILVQSLVLYNDDSFREINSKNSYSSRNDNNSYVLQKKALLKTTAYVFTKFVTFNDDFADFVNTYWLKPDTLDQKYKVDLVTFLSFFTDCEYDVFISSFRVLVKRKQLQFMTQNQTEGYRSEVEEAVDLVRQLDKMIDSIDPQTTLSELDNHLFTTLQQAIQNSNCLPHRLHADFGVNGNGNFIQTHSSLLSTERSFVHFVEALKSQNLVEKVFELLTTHWSKCSLFNCCAVKGPLKSLHLLSHLMKEDITWLSTLFSDHCVTELIRISNFADLSEPTDSVFYECKVLDESDVFKQPARAFPAYFSFYEPQLFACFLTDAFTRNHQLFFQDKSNFQGLLEYFRVILYHFNRNANKLVKLGLTDPFTAPPAQSDSKHTVPSVVTSIQQQCNFDYLKSLAKGPVKMNPTKLEELSKVKQRLLGKELSQDEVNQILNKNEPGVNSLFDKMELRIVERSFCLQRIQKTTSALLLMSDLVRRILKELKRKEKHSVGFHFFLRSSSIVVKVVEDYFFSTELTNVRFLFSQARALHTQELSEGPLLMKAMLRLLVQCNSVFWKSKEMALVKSNFENFAKRSLFKEIDFGHLEERMDDFRMYSAFFNFEKKTNFDEFQLNVANPNILTIKSKFKEEDFNQIYNFDNLSFLMREAQAIVDALEALRMDSDFSLFDSDEKRLLNKYIWKDFLPQVYKLFRGLLVSYFTKMPLIDFDSFTSLLLLLIHRTDNIVRVHRELYEKWVGVNRDKSAARRNSSIPSRSIVFKGSQNILQNFQVQCNSEDDVTVITEKKMLVLRLYLHGGLEGLYKSYCFFFEQHRISLEHANTNTNTDNTDNTNNLRNSLAYQTTQQSLCFKIVDYFYNEIWPLERFQPSHLLDPVDSFGDITFKQSKPKQWQKDSVFVSVMSLSDNNKNDSWNPFESWKKNSNYMLFSQLGRNSSNKDLNFQKIDTLDFEDSVQPTQIGSNNTIAKLITKLPKQFKLAASKYVELKKTEIVQDVLRCVWVSLLTSRQQRRSEDDGEELGEEGLVQEAETVQNQVRMGQFLVTSFLLLNFNLAQDWHLSLSYFDLDFINYVLSFSYFLKSVPGIKEECDKTIARLNDAEQLKRSQFTQSKSDLRTTFHENYYEIYFNLLNLMYWRTKDFTFSFFFTQFNIVNNLLHSISNIQNPTKVQKRGIVPDTNSIAQLIDLLGFFTENSRIHHNKEWQMTFSDREEDLPITSIMLDNVTFLIKKLKGGQLVFDNTFFTYMSLILRRKVFVESSLLYSVQLSGVNAILAIVEKNDANVITHIKENLDYREHYNQMIWLIKFWFGASKVNPKFKRWALKRRTATDSTQTDARASRKSSVFESGDSQSGECPIEPFNTRMAYVESKIMTEESQFYESLLNHEMVNFVDRFVVWISHFKSLKFSARRFAKTLARLSPDYWFLKDKRTYEKTDFFIDGLLRKYSLIKENSLDNKCDSFKVYSLETAVKIYILLKNMSRNIKEVRQFMKLKEEGAMRFELEKQSVNSPHIASQIAESKVLLFLSHIVKQIEVMKEVDGKQQLTTVFFKAMPISTFRSNLIFEKYVDPEDFNDAESLKTHLLECKKDIIIELKNLQKYSRFFGLSILANFTAFSTFFKFVSQVSTVVLTILLIVYLKTPDGNRKPYNFYGNGETVLLWVGIWLCVVSGIWMLSEVTNFIMIWPKQIVREGIKEIQLRKKHHKSTNVLIKSYLLTSKFLSKAYYKFGFSVMIFCFSLLGLLVDYVFWTLSFFFICLENNSFGYIIAGIYINLKNFGYLLLFMGLLILITAFLTFLNFNVDDGKAPGEEICGDFVNCFLNIFKEAYKGGLDSILSFLFNPTENNYWVVFFLNLLFYLLVKQIIFQIIFAIILDYFENVREEQSKRQQRKYTCPICDLDQNSLSEKKLDFKEHVIKVHSVRSYLDYLMFLHLSHYTKLNEYDIEIKKRIDRFDMNWIPANDVLLDVYETREAKVDGGD
jgi:hypothetical protein